mgnify:CR=1 FL=1
MKLKSLYITLVILVFNFGFSQDNIIKNQNKIMGAQNPSFYAFGDSSKVGVLTGSEGFNDASEVESKFAFVNHFFEQSNFSLALDVKSIDVKSLGYSVSIANLHYIYRTQFNYKWTFNPSVSIGYGSSSLNYNSLIFSDQEEIEKSPGDDLISTDDFDSRVDLISQPKVEFALREAGLAAPKWVDFGCGVGDMVKAANNLGCNAVGYDIDQREISHGQQNDSNIHCMDVNLSNVGQYFGDADIISIISVLEHVPNCMDILKMLVNHSKDDTYFLIEVPRYNSISSLVNINFGSQVSRHMLPPNHLMLFTDYAFDIMLFKAGLKRSVNWYYGMDINELFGTMLLNAQNSHIDASGLIKLMNELQAVIDKSKLCDEMLILCQKL